MSDADLIKLYSGQILQLAADIPYLGRLESPQASVRKRSPLCGSTVSVDLRLDEQGRIAEFAQDVKACALGQAAASVLGSVAIGRTRAEVEAAREQLRTMLKSDGPDPVAPFEQLGVLRPARDYKNRHASIMLSLDATAEAMAQAEDTACA
ncbi:iron-sulfur cluster assembly scaffold protein [Roseitranquillus sediminis]|uniref:iron-sulfur cluster assembly scaffold protein n=1 Tax=Roseitranquillus sediminis TaxID=2809051 RepID=UPI001D0C9CBC|nr:iron-sulfur cluster assembly scaffold protein [Roseitranquillus sediminis]MBM9595625.1 iron-sulfur cluster assembly scaffold protein [Roseitranquillus sediminis]